MKTTTTTMKTTTTTTTLLRLISRTHRRVAQVVCVGLLPLAVAQAPPEHLLDLLNGETYECDRDGGKSTFGERVIDTHLWSL